MALSPNNKPRKRDKFRELFKRPGTPSSISSGGVAATTAAPPNAAISPPYQVSPAAQTPLLDRALELLSRDQRKIVHELLPGAGKHELGDAFDQAYQAAQRCKAETEASRSELVVRGRTVVLRDQVDKVLRWLDRFKAVGDVVANVDPIHVGLPWAGFRLILEVALADSRQRAALMTGMDYALDLANRLKVYMGFLNRLSPGQATDNFEKDIVKMYAHVLRFIAQAIQVYNSGAISRVWKALWSSGTLSDFESEADKLGSRTEIAARNCSEEVAERDRTLAREWRDELNRELLKLDDIRDVSKALDRLHLKVDLGKLTWADGATFDSYEESQEAFCLPGTRKDLLEHIANWAADPQSKCIFWLSGKAGTGKSTLARTVAKRLKFHHISGAKLGATFFFKRNRGDRAHAKRFFPTIAKQLADVLPGLDALIAGALNHDSAICDSNLQDQFEQLIYEPVKSLALNPYGPNESSFIIVLDALDECSKGSDIKQILTLIARANSVSSIKIRVFVTSRPELPVELGFQSVDGNLHNDVILDQVQASTIEHDLEAYFRYRLEEMRIQYTQRCLYDPIPPDWVGDAQILTLVTLANPLFIAAFTLCQFISQSDPQARLTLLLTQKSKASFAGLAAIYIPILERSIYEDSTHELEDEIADFRRIVGPLVLLDEPLSAASLSELLDIPLRTIGATLGHLHSVLKIPADVNLPIRTFHLSFREVLVDPKLRHRNKLWIDEAETHKIISEHCIRLLNKGGLKADICNVRKPGTHRTDIDRDQIDLSIPPELAYACRYWISHLSYAAAKISDDGPEHKFLKAHFLHWMEAMCWLGRSSEIASLVGTLRNLIAEDDGKDLIALVTDAQRYVLRYRSMADLAPLQLYVSGIVLAPTNSVIRQNSLQDRMARNIVSESDQPANWDAAILTLGDNRDKILSIAFSHDGLSIASASRDGSIRQWDTRTGNDLMTFGRRGTVPEAIAFSKSGDLFAILTHAVRYGDKPKVETRSSISAWNVTTETQIREWENMDLRLTNTLDLSPNSEVVVIPDDQGKLQLWSMVTKTHVVDLEGKITPHARQSAFSSNSMVFAVLDRFSEDVSESDGSDRVKLWNIATGSLIQEIPLVNVSCYSIALSADGAILSTHESGSMSFRDTLTGENFSTLRETVDKSSTYSAAFSPDAGSFLSRSWAGSIMAWDLSAYQSDEYVPNVLGRGHLGSPMAVSPDSQILATGAIDGSTILWNLKSSESLEDPVNHSTVADMAFSPDGQQLVTMLYSGELSLWNANKCQRDLVIEYRQTYPEIVSPEGEAWAQSFHGEASVHFPTSDETRDLEIEGFARVAALGPHGEVFASRSDGDDFIQFTDVSTGLPVDRLPWDRQLNAMAFSTDGGTLALGSAQAVWLKHRKSESGWDHNDGEVGPRIDCFNPNDHGFRIKSISYPSQDRMIITTSNGRVQLWNPETFEWLTTTMWSSTVGYSPDGRFLASASYFADDNVIKLYNLPENKKASLLYGHSSLISATAFSRDGETLASASFDLTIRIWSTTTWKTLTKLVLETFTGALAISTSNKQILAVSESDRLIRVYDMSTQAWIHQLEDAKNRIRAICISPEGDRIAAIDDGAMVHIWNSDTGKLTRSYDYDGPRVSRLAFSDDGKCLIADGATLDLESSRAKTEGELINAEGLQIRNDWIILEGEDLQFLPAGQKEFATWTSRSDLLAIGLETGGVDFFRLVPDDESEPEQGV